MCDIDIWIDRSRNLDLYLYLLLYVFILHSPLPFHSPLFALMGWSVNRNRTSICRLYRSVFLAITSISNIKKMLHPNKEYTIQFTSNNKTPKQLPDILIHLHVRFVKISFIKTGYQILKAAAKQFY